MFIFVNLFWKIRVLIFFKRKKRKGKNTSAQALLKRGLELTPRSATGQKTIRRNACKISDGQEGY